MQADQMSLIRSLKGAPASIVVALVVLGRSLNNKQLCLATGYSDKTITAALVVLDIQGITQFNGRAAGWSLSAGQLKLNLPEQLSTGYPQVDRKFSDLGPLTTTTTTIQIKDPESTLHTREENVVVVEEDRSEILRSILAAAGIGANSQGMRDLLAAEIPISRAEAWLRYWDWWKRQRERQPSGLVDGRDVFSAGLLIRVLLDGDPAPAARCEECLELPADCYCASVSR